MWRKSLARYLTSCCKQIIESRSVHDFVYCECGKTSVDGGDVYHRYGYETGTEPPKFLGPSKDVEKNFKDNWPY